MLRKILLLAMLLMTLFLSGCLKQTSSEKEEAIKACVEECKARLTKGEDLSNGPCLLNPIPSLPDWVCDVAHSPRQPIDNQPENQCSYYREGKAHHFVEVDEDCNLIKTW